jgi:hypothetical protein
MEREIYGGISMSGYIRGAAAWDGNNSLKLGTWGAFEVVLNLEH